MSHSVPYEPVESRCRVSGSELGVAQLGTQGDPWGAQRDMALATVGRVASAAVLASVERGRRQ